MFCSTVNTHFGRSFHTLFLRVHSRPQQVNMLGLQDVRSRTLRASCILAVPSSLNHRYPPQRQVFLKRMSLSTKFKFTECHLEYNYIPSSQPKSMYFST